MRAAGLRSRMALVATVEPCASRRKPGSSSPSSWRRPLSIACSGSAGVLSSLWTRSRPVFFADQIGKSAADINAYSHRALRLLQVC